MTASTSASFSEAAQRGLGSALVFALSAGLLTALTPCVYPMIPITVSIFGARRASGRARAIGLATLYVAGIATMFGALGTVFALVGRAFGTFMANPWVIVPISALFIAMAFSMFGAFELSLPAGAQDRLSRVGGRGYAGAFLMGLVGGVIAAPCTGPPLAGMLAYVATTRNAVRGFVLLATYAAGIGVPFWAIAAFSLRLPKSGPWMETVKSVFGIALLVAGLYYLKNVVPALARVGDARPGFAVAAAAIAAAGVALGAVHLTFHDGVRRGLRKGAGVALAVVGLFALTNYALAPRVALGWLRSETAALERARAGGKPVVVDFMADWCLPCKELEAHVFSRPDVARALDDFVLLRVDLSREDEDTAVAALKAKYGVATLPAIRLLGADGGVVARADTQISADELMRLLDRARS